MAKKRRRWFQFGLAEWLILTGLLGIAWWQCIRWPVPDTELPEESERKPTRREAMVRMAISTVAIVGVWLVGSIAVRGFLGRPKRAKQKR
jgi:hypothetical protein